MSSPTPEETITTNPDAQEINKATFEEKRAKKKKIDELLPKIERKSQECYLLEENIQYERIKLDETQREIKLSKDKLEDLRNKLDAIKGKGNISNKSRLTILKQEIINKKLEELLSEKIPEAGLSNYRKKKDQSENEFKNIIYNNVEIIYCIYSFSTMKCSEKLKQNFNICKNTKFKSIKEAACNFWGILNPNEYLLTDESEAIIYNEEMEVDEFLRSYSVRFQKFHLISASLLRSRNKLLDSQECMMRNKNLFQSKWKKQSRKNVRGSSLEYVNEFTNEYTGLKPYFLKKDENAVEKDLLEGKKQARELDTSLIMFALIIIFMSFTIAFIYRGERNSVLNNKKYASLKDNLLIENGMDKNSLTWYLNENFIINFANNKIQKQIMMVVSLVKEKKCENSYSNIEKIIKEKGEKCYYPKYSKRNKLDKGELKIDNDIKKYDKGKFDFSLDTLGGKFDGSGFNFNYSTD